MRNLNRLKSIRIYNNISDTFKIERHINIRLINISFFRNTLCITIW